MLQTGLENAVSRPVTDDALCKSQFRVSLRRFHAHAVVMEMETYEAGPRQKTLTQTGGVQSQTRSYTGVPPGAGPRQDESFF